MRKLDPEIAEVLKRFGFGPDAAWNCHGVWVVYHRVLEQIAAKAGIVFASPQIVEANGAAGVAAVCVSGTLADKAEWSIGEASPKNNKNAYPWAMAEKRAKDRVVLKLIGLHGLAYSEDEADDFKAPAQPPAQTTERSPREHQKAGNEPVLTEAEDALFKTYRMAIESCTDPEDLRDWYATNRQKVVAELPTNAARVLRGIYDTHLANLEKEAA